MKPTEEELAAAFAVANKMREEGDPDHVHKVLAYLLYRTEILENLTTHAVRYVKFGMDEHEHSLMIKAVDRLREFDTHQSGEESEEMGLG
ncbi:MAG: hypothetical protein GWP66_03375 [Gammaproteobacteria bacterium]|nr:hypothetical protein [Gammaproteobacteria bacterium]